MVVYVTGICSLLLSPTCQTSLGPYSPASQLGAIPPTPENIVQCQGGQAWPMHELLSSFYL